MLRDTSDAAADTGRARLIQGSENGCPVHEAGLRDRADARRTDACGVAVRRAADNGTGGPANRRLRGRRRPPRRCAAAARTAHSTGHPRRAVGPERRAGARASAAGARPPGRRARGGAGRGPGTHARRVARGLGRCARTRLGVGHPGNADAPRGRCGDVRQFSGRTRRGQPVACRRHPHALSSGRSRGGLRRPPADPKTRDAAGQPVSGQLVVADWNHHQALSASGHAVDRLRSGRVRCRRHRQPHHSRGQLGGPKCSSGARLDLVRGDGRTLRAVADAPEPAAVHGR